MEPIAVAFITGLTAGGLSCLAVQGGLLAGSLALQIEQDLLVVPAKPGQDRSRPASRPSHNTALPIALFLLAKIIAYTLLGALLGLLGSFMTLSPVLRAVLLLAIGVFMVGNALRMLNVHPIFRYFVIEPPRFATRTIRRTAKRETDFFTPLFLGALTVLIPCGVTQAMMAVALGSGSPATGAALMAAFTLGTSPVFFLAAYLAMQIGTRFQSYFLRFVAIVVLILGLVTVESGLNLLGSPISFASLTRTLRPADQAAAAADRRAGPCACGERADRVRRTPCLRRPRRSTRRDPVAAGEVAETPLTFPVSSASVIELRVANNGYSPQVLRAPANQEVSLDLVTSETYSCAGLRHSVDQGLPTAAGNGASDH